MKLKLEKFYEQVTPQYLQTRQEELPSVEKLMINREYLELQNKFHKIAGSGGGYGLQIITEIASRIEHAAEQQNNDILDKEFANYKQCLSDLELEFE